jgi:hypothetical protein
VGVGGIEVASTPAAVRSSSLAAMKKLLFLGACLVALASQPVMAQTSGPDVVIVRVEESYSGKLKLFVERAGQETEAIVFEETKKENMGKGYYPFLNKLYQQGYQMQGIIPGAMITSGFAVTTSTLVFVKATSK